MKNNNNTNSFLVKDIHLLEDKINLLISCFEIILRKEVNISNLKSGIYLMKVTIDNAVGTYKIIKN